MLEQVLQRLWAAGEQSGAAFMQADREDILGMADGIADAWVDKTVTAIVGNISDPGMIQKAEWEPIKKALLASEPQLDQATNDAIAALFDRIVAVLKKA